MLTFLPYLLLYFRIGLANGYATRTTVQAFRCATLVSYAFVQQCSPHSDATEQSSNSLMAANPGQRKSTNDHNAIETHYSFYIGPPIATPIL